MKIKSLGFTSVKLSFKNVDMVTDPVVAKEATGSFGKVGAEVVLHTSVALVGKKEVLKDGGLEGKVEAKEGRSLIEISSPGEYEIGEVFIRRNLQQNFYILDEGDTRVVVIGEDCKNTPSEAFKSLGDVDLLVLPVGDGDRYMGYEKLEKIIKMIDPTYLVPTGFAESGSKISGLKTLEEFKKHFGYANVVEEKTLSVTKVKDEEDKRMSVVVLKD